MRKTVLIFLALAAATATAQARGSIWDGAYTDAQADRGHTAYMQNCSRCHGESLGGTYEIPPLIGRIMPYYSGGHVDALLDYISTAMPLGRPGSLSPATNADIVAYILKMNDAPSGKAELTADTAKTIRFETAKPQRK